MFRALLLWRDMLDCRQQPGDIVVRAKHDCVMRRYSCQSLSMRTVPMPNLLSVKSTLRSNTLLLLLTVAVVLP